MSYYFSTAGSRVPLEPKQCKRPAYNRHFAMQEIAGYLLPFSARPQSEKSAGNYLVMSAGR
jgi:hypothetical protein